MPPADWEARLKALPFVESVSGEGNVYRIVVEQRSRDDAGADGGGRRSQRHRALALGPEHDARRRVRALHGTRAARRAAGSVGDGFAIHASGEA